jgi:hypothetical protein
MWALEHAQKEQDLPAFLKRKRDAVDDDDAMHGDDPDARDPKRIRVSNENINAEDPDARDHSETKPTDESSKLRPFDISVKF